MEKTRGGGGSRCVSFVQNRRAGLLVEDVDFQPLRAEGRDLVVKTSSAAVGAGGAFALPLGRRACLRLSCHGV